MTFIAGQHDDATSVTPTKVLAFVTGAQLPPPMGFAHQPSIHFTAHGTLPTASTCSCTLFLPLHQTVNPDPGPAAADYVYETFKERMDTAILKTVGFGQV